MKLFITDINSLKEKFIKTGFLDRDVKKIITVLTENNKFNELEDSKKKEARSSIEESPLVKEFECKFECHAASQALTLEGAMHKLMEGSVKKIVKWLSPIYVGGIVVGLVVLKPYIYSSFKSIYCFFNCNHLWEKWLGLF